MTIVANDVRRLQAEQVALRDAIGRVLATDVVSPLALPPWDNASMDGYAARADDVRGASVDMPRTLTVVGTVAAGDATSRPVAAREAMRIMTGAPIPAGADSVIRVEDTDGGSHTVLVLSDRDALHNVRPRGEDLAPGTVAVTAGTELHAAHIALLASVGHARVDVIRRPRVAILASGDELVDVDDFDAVLAGERIVSSNSYFLDAAVREAGGDVVSLGIARDDPAELRRRLAGVDCDLLITTGGVSVGTFDFTRSVLADLGIQQRFWRVRMRPGAPIGFGLLHEIPWLGLPGNPVSSAVTFELFARPAIRKLRGHTDLFRALTRVRVAEAVAITAPLTHFLRAVVRLDGQELVARLTGPQGSGLVSSMARANALLVIDASQSRLASGERVDALLFGDALHVSESPIR